jgi:hypothetical protein
MKWVGMVAYLIGIRIPSNRQKIAHKKISNLGPSMSSKCLQAAMCPTNNKIIFNFLKNIYKNKLIKNRDMLECNK